HHARGARRYEGRVVAVGAVPRASLAEDSRGQAPGPVHARHWYQASDLEVVSSLMRGVGESGAGAGRDVSHCVSSSSVAGVVGACVAVAGTLLEIAAAASVNIVRSAYSPFLPMLNELTGRKEPMTRVRTWQTSGSRSGCSIPQRGQVPCSPVK